MKMEEKLRKQSKATKDKISKSLLGKKNPMFIDGW